MKSAVLNGTFMPARYSGRQDRWTSVRSAPSECAPVGKAGRTPALTRNRRQSLAAGEGIASRNARRERAAPSYRRGQRGGARTISPFSPSPPVAVTGREGVGVLGARGPSRTARERASMPTLLRSTLLPSLVAAALTTGVLATPAAAAPPSDTTAATAAASYLASHLTHAGTVTGSFDDGKGNVTTYTDWGRTLDAALGLLAAGGQDATLGRALTSVEDPSAVAEYTQGAPGDKADAAYVGATAKLAFVVAATGGDPTKAGGVNLITQLSSLQTTDGQYAGRSSFGNYANLFGHAFAVLALKQAGQTVPDAV